MEEINANTYKTPEHHKFFYFFDSSNEVNLEDFPIISIGEI